MFRKSSLIIYCIFFSVTIPGTAIGQATSTGWGFKAGLNSSGNQTDNVTLVQNSAKLGWQAGIFSKTMDNGWGYLAELSLLTMGSKQVVGDESQKNTIGYLTVPLALQYYDGNHWGFLLGGYASFRLWAKRKSTKAGEEEVKTDIKDNVAFMDYGLWAGVSFSQNKFIFDLRYQQGIGDINTNANVNAKVYNTSGQFSISYLLQ